MRAYVIDANIIISMLISGKASYRPILTFFNFYTSEFSFEEIEKYRPLLFEKTKLDEEQFRRFALMVYKEISVVPNLIITKHSLSQAIELTSSIDIKDVSYVSLAIELNRPLLTRDKVLVNGLRKKGFKKIQLFDEFLRGL